MLCKPATPCSYPGFPPLTHDRYCDGHAKLAKLAKHNYRKYERDPAIDKRYGRQWRKIRVRYVAEHPLCEQCQKEGRLTPTQEVHHILPLSRGGTHDFSNLMALCKSCHSASPLSMVTGGEIAGQSSASILGRDGRISTT